MNETKRVVPILLGHFLIAFIICLIYTFARPLEAVVIDPFMLPFRIRRALILFISWIPALQISGILVGYALVFGKNSAAAIDRWSGTLLSYLKGAFILCLACISIYVVLSEGVSPFLKKGQEEAVVRTGDYQDYLDVSRQSLKDGKYEEADFQATVALQIWGASAEANELRERVRYLLASADEEKPAARKAERTVISGSTGLTVLDALDRAGEAMKTPDFYTAHYYAMMAYRLAPGTDPNKQVALRLASNAWNRIREGLASLEMEDDRALLGTKKKGYDAIQSGDYLTAYYIFLELHEKEIASDDGKIDPDVERFLEVSKQGVLDSFFFMDETGNMKRFEAARDIFFVLRRADGSSDAVFARGVTWKRSGGQDMAYLRDLEYAHIGWDQTLLYRMSVPYAKMFPYIAADGSSKPEILLHAVDRTLQGVETLPTVIEGTAPEDARNILVLDMPFGDFNLIVEANRGVASMTLLDLIKFERKAEAYGFSRKVFRCEIINRLAEPFLMLIISINALILGWRFRLGKNVLFRAWWVLALPLFPLLSHFVMDLVRYVARVVVVAAVRAVPQNPILIVLLFLALWFVGVSVYFFSQRSD